MADNQTMSILATMATEDASTTEITNQTTYPLTTTIMSTVPITTEENFSTVISTWTSLLSTGVNLTNSSVTSPTTTCSIKLSDDKYVNALNEFAYVNIYYPAFVFTIMMFIIGAPGNALVFYVYWRKWKKTTSRIFIMALAGFDLINCLFMPYEAANIRNIVRFDYDGSCKFTRMMTFAMNNCSSFTLFAIAVDRYIRICRPLKPSITNSQAKRMVLIAIIIAVLFAIPAAILYGTMTFPSPTKTPGECIIGKVCLISDKYLATSYPLIFGATLLAGNLAIDLVLIISYTLIAIQVFRRGQFDDCRKVGRSDSVHSSNTTDNDIIDTDTEVFKRSPIVRNASTRTTSSDGRSSIAPEVTPLKQQSDNGSVRNDLRKSPSKSSASSKRSLFSKQRSMSISSMDARRARVYKTTLMLFLVTLLFMVSFVPYCVIVIVRYTNESYYNSLSLRGKLTYQLVLRFYLLSSALNPVIYSFLSEQFRTECKNVFKRITCRSAF